MRLANDPGAPLPHQDLRDLVVFSNHTRFRMMHADSAYALRARFLD